MTREIEPMAIESQLVVPHSEFYNPCIVGLGDFGLAFLTHIGRIQEETGIHLTAYSWKEYELEAIRDNGTHPKRFKDVQLPGADRVNYVSDICGAVQDADLIVMATPSSSTRAVLQQIRHALQPGVVFLNTAKALDEVTGNPLSEVYGEELGDIDVEYALFAGGTRAEEFIAGIPLGADVASNKILTARRLARFLALPRFLSVHPSDDLRGVELASSLKNVISVFVGMAMARAGEDLLGPQTRVMTELAGKITDICCDELGANRSTFDMRRQCWGNDMVMSSLGKTRNNIFGREVIKQNSVRKAMEIMDDNDVTVESLSTIRSLDKHPELSKLLQIEEIRLLHQLVTTEVPDEALVIEQIWESLDRVSFE